MIEWRQTSCTFSGVAPVSTEGDRSRFRFTMGTAGAAWWWSARDVMNARREERGWAESEQQARGACQAALETFLNPKRKR